MIDPWFVTGFTDGEGSFHIKIINEIDKRRSNQKIYWCRWVPIFSVGLRGDDVAMLYKIKEFFGCGLVYHYHKTSQVHNHGFAYFQEVSTIKHAEIIIPHFESFPLQTKKANDFKLWREVVMILYSTKRENKIWPRELSKLQKEELLDIYMLLRKRLTGSKKNKGCTNPGFAGTAYRINDAATTN